MQAAINHCAREEGDNKPQCLAEVGVRGFNLLNIADRDLKLCLIEAGTIDNAFFQALYL